MQVTQRMILNRAVFNFKKDKLYYTIKDSGGSRTFSIDYGQIQDSDFNEIEEKNHIFVNLGAVMMFLGLYHYHETQMIGSLIAYGVFFIIMVLVHTFLVTRYTTISTEKGDIYVIQNKEHDSILREIDGRRKLQWKEWYGTINYNADPSEEIAKFEWIFNKGVISAQEFEIAKIEIYKKSQRNQRIVN